MVTVSDHLQRLLQFSYGLWSIVSTITILHAEIANKLSTNKLNVLFVVGIFYYVTLTSEISAYSVVFSNR